MPTLLRGPRDLRVWVNSKMERVWRQRCPHVLSSLEHALRYSEVVTPVPDDNGRETLLLGYRLERVLFIVKRNSGYPSWHLTDLFSALLQPHRFGKCSNKEKKLYRDLYARYPEQAGQVRRVAIARQVGPYLECVKQEARGLLATWPIQKMHVVVERSRLCDRSTLGGKRPGNLDYLIYAMETQDALRKQGLVVEAEGPAVLELAGAMEAAR